MECRERAHGEQLAHLAAIDAIVERWHSGEISILEKRQLISTENAFFHGRQLRGRTGKLLTADHAEQPREPAAHHAPWWRDA